MLLRHRHALTLFPTHFHLLARTSRVIALLALTRAVALALPSCQCAGMLGEICRWGLAGGVSELGVGIGGIGGIGGSLAQSSASQCSCCVKVPVLLLLLVWA